ncbi:tol protein [Colletotrichum kahawae]|uniref:Tol protein n=1 Tax=Colletotrichum kahawae TaxID=34407 RepID=A0AAE0D5R6_COLKA|nr:tol protein [Colletotrichum kahawae]
MTDPGPLQGSSCSVVPGSPTRDQDELPTRALETTDEDASSDTRPKLPGACSRCVKLSELIRNSLDDLPPGFDDISSDAPGFIKVANLGKTFRTQFQDRPTSPGLLVQACQKVGLFQPTCNLCVMLSMSRPVWKEETCLDELRLMRLNALLLFPLVGVDRERIQRDGDGPLRQSPLYLSVIPEMSTLGLMSNSYLGDMGSERGYPAIYRWGHLPKAAYLPSLVQPRFDAGLACKWLDYCKENHRGLCLPRLSMLSGLCLIHCRSRTVVAAPEDAEYVALSYCWGQPEPRRPWFQWWSGEISTEFPVAEDNRNPAHGGIHSYLPLDVPTVISDAMLVTISLGFSYLWVDRYCIDQTNSDKYKQINQMDSIYQRAELTIIAAAGEDPSYGLPGTSAWYTRGWTFQEGILSRRRLVFTDEQVYYECDSMYCYESIIGDLDSLHEEDKTRFKDVLKGGLFGRRSGLDGFSQSSWGPQRYESLLHKLIEQYTERMLTYDSDSLNAFSGILRSFERSPLFISSIWGVTIRRTEDSAGGDEASFVAGLSWRFDIWLRVDGRSPNRRRKGFPSCSLHSLALEDGDGVLLSPTEYVSKARLCQAIDPTPPVLRITGHVLPPSAIVKRFKQSQSDPSKLDGRVEIFGFSPWVGISMIDEDEYESIGAGGSRRCVWVGDNGKKISRRILNFLVLEPLHGDNWRRVGSIYLHLDMKGMVENLFEDRIDEAMAERFWKSWVDHEFHRPIPQNEVERYIAELPTQSFRVIAYHEVEAFRLKDSDEAQIANTGE